jgi:hemerythrin-like metal-binding protein
MVLRGFCRIANENMRSTDAFGRWGGEEFLFLVAENGLQGALTLAERVRVSLQGSHFPGVGRVTVSIGVAECRAEEDFGSLLARADAAMYLAKLRGRNQVVVNDSDGENGGRLLLQDPRFLELPWKRVYESGHPLIDAEHRGLFKGANRILAEVRRDGSGSKTWAMIQDLLSEVITHFDHEEALLVERGYPEFDLHRQIHQGLLERADELVQGLDRNEVRPSDLIGFLVHDVVAEHMLQDDRKFFPWFQGVPG